MCEETLQLNARCEVVHRVGVLGYDAVWIGKFFPTFRGNVGPSSSRGECHLESPGQLAVGCNPNCARLA